MSDRTIPGEQTPKRLSHTSEVELVIGARMKVLRTAAGISQADLGRAIGVSSQQVQKYEKGTVRIAVSTLMALATALGILPGAFFDDEMLTSNGADLNIKTSLNDATDLQQVTNPAIRRHLAALVRALADEREP